MKTLRKTRTALSALTGLAACGLLCQTAQADNLSTIDIEGVAQFNNTLQTATAVRSVTQSFVSDDSDGMFQPASDFIDLAPGNLVPVTWSGFNFPHVGNQSLWTFTVGAYTYSLSLGQVAVVSQGFAPGPFGSIGFLNLTGTGSVTISTTDTVNDPLPPNYAPGNTGTWTFTASTSVGNHTKFGFQSTWTDPPSIPDGSMTITLLGLALVGVGGLRRWMAKL